MEISRRCLEATVPGASIYLEVTGPAAGSTKPPVVLCHGAGGNHAIWFRQVAAFAPERDVITWDHRGFGRTVAHEGIGEPAVSRGDLGAVLDAAGVERAHVVAQSMGGWTALGFTIEHPERVVSLTLADTVAGIGTDAVARNWAEYLERRKRGRGSRGVRRLVRARHTLRPRRSGGRVALPGDRQPQPRAPAGTPRRDAHDDVVDSTTSPR